MSDLKHLKTLQHVSIIIQIIFRELVGSLLKSLNLKFFYKFFKIVEVICGNAATLPQITSTNLKEIIKIFNSVTLRRNLRAP
jgi:hypothetical protein